MLFCKGECLILIKDKLRMVRQVASLSVINLHKIIVKGEVGVNTRWRSFRLKRKFMDKFMISAYLRYLAHIHIRIFARSPHLAKFGVITPKYGRKREGINAIRYLDKKCFSHRNHQTVKFARCAIIHVVLIKQLTWSTDVNTPHSGSIFICVFMCTILCTYTLLYVFVYIHTQGKNSHSLR